MNRAALALLLGAAAPLLNGCVLAVAPMLAASTIGGTELKKRRAAQAKVAAAMPNAAARPAAPVVTAAASPVPPPVAPPPPAAAPAPGVALVVPSTVPAPYRPLVPGTLPPAMKFVPGSADSAVASTQAWGALADYLGRAAALYRAKKPQRQFVIVDGASLAAPYFEPCGAKPPAVVVDLDESTSAELGLDSAGQATADGWQRWERDGTAKVAAAPGAVAALAAARGAGIDVIFNTNRASARADDTVAALTAAGLGPVEHYKTLWMRGDDGGGAEKDNRRWAIASGYCVVALVGDELGDFSDAFTAGLTPARRKALAVAPTLASLWGNGWFVVPNAVHGAAQ